MSSVRITCSQGNMGYSVSLSQSVTTAQMSLFFNGSIAAYMYIYIHIRVIFWIDAPLILLNNMPHSRVHIWEIHEKANTIWHQAYNLQTQASVAYAECLNMHFALTQWSKNRFRSWCWLYHKYWRIFTVSQCFTNSSPISNIFKITVPVIIWSNSWNVCLKFHSITQCSSTVCGTPTSALGRALHSVLVSWIGFHDSLDTLKSCGHNSEDHLNEPQGMTVHNFASKMTHKSWIRNASYMWKYAKLWELQDEGWNVSQICVDEWYSGSLTPIQFTRW